MLTYKEAKPLEHNLTNLYADICRNPSDRSIRKAFNDMWFSITRSGIRINRRKNGTINGYTSYKYSVVNPIPTYHRHKAILENVNLNPKGLRTNDCTTRTLSYIVKSHTYQQLREEQNQASLRHYGDNNHWNYESAYERVFSNHGYSKITLKKKLTRTKIAQILKDFPHPIATKSSHHIAAIHHGKLIDTWDSSNGRVSTIYAPTNTIHLIEPKLNP